MIIYLTTEDLLVLVDDLGVGPVRDLGLLESAVHRPSTSLWGTDVYPSVLLKAAALLDSVANNRALVDGNKRLAWLATVVFLDLNGVWIEAPDDDAYDLVIAVTEGTASLDQIADSLGIWIDS